MKELTGKTVLIVDDDDRNTFALRSYLESLDMNIAIAGNGEDALKQLEDGLKPALILLDMMMPVMDGYETLAALKQHEVFKEFPVIAVTAKAMKGDKEKCLEAGAWDYISKPINLNALMVQINKWIK